MVRPRAGPDPLRRIYLAVLSNAAAYGGGIVVVAWLILAGSGSAADVGAVFALRMAPLVVVGPFAGALADRWSRANLLVVTNLATAAIFFILTLVTASPDLLVPVLWLSTIALGSLDAVRLATTGALVVDAASTGSGTNAIAMSQLTGRIGAGVGGFGFGVGLSVFGPGVSFAAAGTLNAVAVLSLARVVVAGGPSGGQARMRGAIVDGVRLVATNRRVRLLAIAAIVAEVFGFSNDGILPVFAERVLALGAGGLGLLYLAVRAGSVICLVVIVRSRRRFDGASLVGLLVLFGLSLAAFGGSAFIWPSLLFLAVAGGCAAAIDAFEQTFIQNVVGAAERGRAMGIWTVCLGSGPVGFVALGAMADAFGAPRAQIIAGGAMAAIAVILGLVPGAIADLRGIPTTTAAAATAASIP